MSKTKSKSSVGKVAAILAVVVILLAAVFLIGRYGWKLSGFSACQSAGIESVEVSGQSVHITGFYPGSFPQGFCGYYSQERNGTLYVGFRFSGLFGMLETGDFDITIPVKGEIQEVIVKTKEGEHSIWKAADPVPGETTPNETTPSETTPSETSPTDTQAAQGTEAAQKVPDAYAAILDQYDTAFRAGWNAAQFMDAGLNYLAADSVFTSPLEDIGYAIVDLDGDDVEELVIGSLKEDDFYGKLVFSMYGMSGDGAALLLDSSERNLYYYAGENRFANLGSSGWNESFVTTVKLQNNELVDMTHTTNPENYVQMELIPFSQWGK